jgi:putative transposase
MVSRLAQGQRLSIRRSCRLVNLSRAAYYRDENKLAVRDTPVVEALNAVVAKHGRWGFWKCHDGCGLQVILGTTSESGECIAP